MNKTKADRIVRLLRAETHRDYNLEDVKVGGDQRYRLIEQGTTQRHGDQEKITDALCPDDLYLFFQSFYDGWQAGQSDKWVCDCQDKPFETWWSHADHEDKGGPICPECGEDMKRP